MLNRNVPNKPNVRRGYQPRRIIKEGYQPTQSTTTQPPSKGSNVQPIQPTKKD